MTRTRPKDQVITVAVDVPTLREINLAARGDGVSRSEWVRRRISWGLLNRQGKPS